MNKTVKTLLIVICALLILVFLYSGYKLTSTIHNYREADRYYSNQVEKYTSYTDEDRPSPTVRPGAPSQGEPAANIAEISPRSVDFDALLADCPDVKGWLYSPDTVIDYPVVQGQNNDFYLHRLMDGTYNPNGTLFIDYRCPGNLSGKHTVIYGHHMQNGSMLASIVNYKDQEYYEAHPVLYLNTPQGNYRLDVFSGFITWYDSRVYLFDFESIQEYTDWYELMRSYSDFSSDVEVTPGDRIVTLSTCTYEYDNARYVLMAKLTELEG